MNNKKINELYKIFDSSEKGLTSSESLKRLNKYGKNILPKKKSDGFFKIFVKEFLNPIVLLLAVTVVFSFAVGEITDAIVIVFIILLDLFLGTFQEWKAERSADSLANIIKVNVNVLRDGKETMIDSSELVIGDIMILDSGDKVSADAVIIESHNLTVNESVLTGESINVSKNKTITDENVPISSMSNMLFGGTEVITGRCRAIVVKTGIDTEVGKIALNVYDAKEEKSPLSIRMMKFSRQISLLIIILAILLTILLFNKGMALKDIFLAVIALCVSAMPEGLPLALTMALTITSNRMMKKNCLVKKLNSVEALGSCTYIASDKTGTLTVNEQTAKRIVFPDEDFLEVTGVGYNFDGKLVGKDIKRGKNIALLGYLNNEANLEFVNGEYVFYGDSIDIAFKALGKKALVDDGGIEILGLIPYESENKYSAVFFKNKNEYYISIKGSLEVVLGFCPKDNHEKIYKQNEKLAKDGYRVIAIASAKVDNIPKKDDYTEEDIGNLTVDGLVAFIDPIRKEAKTAIRECLNAGINVIMITGDHPLTAFSIAKELGICKNENEVLTGMELEKLKDNPKNFDEKIKKIKVFSRVTPMDKLDIVNALKRNGEFVAVTGDGVNDAPALKSANIGIAMGSGTDVAKETADMIILDDKFSSIVEGVREGRGAYSNIRKISFMLLSCGIAEVLSFVLAILFDLPMPLLAVQLLWLNIVTDGLQDFALSFEKPEKNIMKLNPRKPNDALFDKELFMEVAVAGLTMGLIVFGVWNILLSSGLELNVARGYIMALMVFMQNIHVLNCRSERISAFKISLKSNYWVLLAIGSSIFLQILVMEVPILSNFLNTTSISIKEMLMLLGFSFIILVVMEVYKFIKRKVFYERI